MSTVTIFTLYKVITPCFFNVVIYLIRNIVAKLPESIYIDVFLGHDEGAFILNTVSVKIPTYETISGQLWRPEFIKVNRSTVRNFTSNPATRFSLNIYVSVYSKFKAFIV